MSDYITGVNSHTKHETTSLRMEQNHRKVSAYTKSMNKGNWSQHYVLWMT